MSRPVRTYETQFTHESGLTYTTVTVGVTPCAAKQVGWVILQNMLKNHPNHPQGEWRLVSHLQQVPSHA